MTLKPLRRCVAQYTGVLVVNNYQVMLYNALGLKDSLPLLLYACYDTWAAIKNFVNSLMLDRWVESASWLLD
jgi:hypothetical protein